LSETTEFTFDAILIIIKTIRCWNWLPESITFVSSDVNFCKLSNICSCWRNISQNWMFIKPEFLWSFGIWVINVFLESNAEWKRNNIISKVWKIYLLCWRFANHMFIIKYLTFNYYVVIICSEFASSGIFHFVVKSLS
jgi:hypothetical protein